MRVSKRVSKRGAAIAAVAVTAVLGLAACSSSSKSSGGAQALSLNASAIPSIVARQVTLEKETAGTNIKVVAKHETDLANGPKDTENAVATNLRANKDINMIWALQDFEIVTSLKTIQSQGLQKAGIYGYYPPPDAFAAMRAWKTGDAPIVAADSPIKYSPWYAFDSLVNKLCLGKSTGWQVQQSEKPLPVKVFIAGSTNPDNKVPTGDYYDWPAFAPYFLEKWAGEGVQVNGTGAGKSCAGKKVGLVEIVPPSVSPAVGEMEKTAKEVSAILGWNIDVAAADGTPAQMAAVIQTQVTKGVDAILNVAIQPAAATQSLQAAKTANIPVIGIGAVFDDPNKLLSAVYGPSEVEMSTALANQMKKDYK